MTTAATKRAATKEIKLTKEYFCDLVNEVLTQHPQPNGYIYLFGEVITRRRVREAAQDLTNAINYRNSLNV